MAETVAPAHCAAETDTPHWEGEVRLPFAQFPFTYKYAVRLPSGQLLLEVGGGLLLHACQNVAQRQALLEL